VGRCLTVPDTSGLAMSRVDIAGKYVWHCHILEHEDNDMMRPYDVV
jgi:spore coat protein A, manganese oxidase